jgi:sec-independent protein translocase protein TatB
MEFLNVGLGELLIIATVALLVLGPEEMLKLAQTAGREMQKLRCAWAEFSSLVQADMLNPKAEVRDRTSARERDESQAASEATSHLAPPMAPPPEDEEEGRRALLMRPDGEDAEFDERTPDAP